MFVIVGSEPVEIGINDALASKVGSIPCSPSNPDFEIRADVEAPWVYRIAEEREPVLRVTRDEAIHDTFNVLSTGPFRSHFTGRYQYRVRCREVESSKWQCEPEWGARGNDYWGTVTIYAVWEEGNPVWNFRYRLSWVRDACYVRFRNCPTWTRQH
jgi:hypothetical protein